MGRGGSRGKDRMGRGNYRRSARGQKRKHGFDASEKMTSRDVSHFRQFGEKHPSQELDQNQEFGRQISKRGKFNARRGQSGRGRGRGGRNFSDFSSNVGSYQGSTANVESESESSEDEQTPYSELLTVFAGKSSEVQVLSDSSESDSTTDNEESKEVDTVDRDHNTSTNLSKTTISTELGSSSSSSDEELPKNSEADIDNNDKANREKLAKSKNCDNEEDKDEEYSEVEGPDELVIEEAEIDPEMDVKEKCENTSTSLVEDDPFFEHFEREMADSFQVEIKKDNPDQSTCTIEWPVLEKFTFSGFRKHPNSELDINVLTSTSIDLSSVDKLPRIKIPDPPAFPTRKSTLELLHIKSQLHSTIPLVNKVNIGESLPLSSLQTELIDLASRYHDIYYPVRTISNAEEIRVAYCIHVANHILKTRTRILHHNAKLNHKSEVPASYRDQGFVRPKVLILAPFKDSALRILKTIISLILKEEKGNVANSKRFVDDYGGQTLFMPKTNQKPEDYMTTFSGNVEDNFKIGMAVTKKSIKLYTGFYSSDIIVASPLGLRMIIGAEGEKDRDHDFLSSIEVLILDQADVFLMQNWDHVLHITRHLHLQPVTTHGTDFARIRPWALDGLSKYYCQTLVFSSVACPEHSSLMSKYCRNYAGKVRLIQTNVKGTIRHVTIQLPQIFQMFKSDSIHAIDDARFEYFVKQVLPQFKERLMSHTLIFVSSYFDYVRIRNYFKRDEVSFVQICEYTKDKKIARARDLFFHGSNHFLLYTERAHFFRRFRLKGIGHIIFYQLPQNPHFYPELCDLMQERIQNRKVRHRKNSSVNVIYCKYDAPRLAAIVGTERASQMLSSDKKIHAFVSGEL